jgi:hypothetical protein
MPKKRQMTVVSIAKAKAATCEARKQHKAPIFGIHISTHERRMNRAPTGSRRPHRQTYSSQAVTFVDAFIVTEMG